MRILGLKPIRADLLIAIVGVMVGFFSTGFDPWNIVRAEENQGGFTASMDRKSIQVGEIAWLILRYRLPEGASTEDPPKIGGIEGISILEQVLEPDLIRIKLFADRLESWQSDSLALTFVDKEGSTQTLKTDPVSLTVHSALGEKPTDAQLRPIRDIIFTKGPWWSYWPWAAGIAGLGLTILCAYLWYRKKRNRDIPAEMMEPAHVRARKAIEALEREQVFEKGGVKAFYFTFSEIMRRYLESIRNFPAVEYTTEEISNQVRLEEDRKLLPLLYRADLVKFADAMPTPARKEEDVRWALIYIDETCPRSEGASSTDTLRRIDGGRP